MEQAERLAAAEAAAASRAEAQRQAAAALARRETRAAGSTRARRSTPRSRRRARRWRRWCARRRRPGRARAAEAARAELERDGGGRAWPVCPRRRSRAAAARRQLEAGRARFVERLGAEGVLAELPDGRGRARVTVGEMTVDVDGRRAAAAGGAGPRGRARRADGRAAGRGARSGGPAGEDSWRWSRPRSRRTLDVRGQNGDEALAALDAFLDRAALVGRDARRRRPRPRHGRAAQARARPPRRDRPTSRAGHPGTPRQGGDGASIIELR